jgi:hypothetical protein
MTDDPNLDPNLEPKPEPNVLRDEVGPTEAGDELTEGGDEAEDLDETQLEAAAEDAEDDVSDEEEAAAEDDTVVLQPGGIEAAPIGAPGAPRYEPDVRGPRVRGPKAASRTAFAIDPALRIGDRASAAFVIISVAVFALILANAMLFGHGGALTPIPTASPIPVVTEGPSESPSAVPSISPAPSGSTAPTTSPSGSPSGSTAPTTAPTAAPSSAPTAAPSPAAS